jgi:hypothetical protein
LVLCVARDGPLRRSLQNVVSTTLVSIVTFTKVARCAKLCVIIRGAGVDGWLSRQSSYSNGRTTGSKALESLTKVIFFVVDALSRHAPSTCSILHDASGAS